MWRRENPFCRSSITSRARPTAPTRSRFTEWTDSYHSQAGAARLALFDIDGTAADGLAARLGARYPALALETGGNDPQGHDIAVNATPLGMKPGDPLPMDPARIARDGFACDVVLTREETPFLAAARARGCRTQPGADMVFAQAPAVLEFLGFPAAAPEELRRVAELDD